MRKICLRCLPANIQVIIPDDLIEMEDVALDSTLVEVHAMLGDDYRYTPSGLEKLSLFSQFKKLGARFHFPACGLPSLEYIHCR